MKQDKAILLYHLDKEPQTMARHRQYPEQKRRKREQELSQREATITQESADDEGGGEKPLASEPRSWTPEFCRMMANRAEELGKYGVARGWRTRALVIEAYHSRLAKEPNRPHPYRRMNVDALGGEISSMSLTDVTKEIILGSVEGGLALLPAME